MSVELQQPPRTGKDPMCALWEHRQHVFIFTRAGKPVFALHGNEEHMSPLFALFQVLLHMNEDDDDVCDGESANSTADGSNRNDVGQQQHRSLFGHAPLLVQDAATTSTTATTLSSSSSADEVRQVIYYQPYPDTVANCGVHEVQALTLFFYVQGELMYVMAQRTAAPAPPSHHSDTRDYDESVPYASTAPPVASYCAAQLRHVHHFVLLVLPNINALLRQQPSLDVMPIFTASDRAALRELIEGYTTRLTYAVGAMATLTLSVERRLVVEGSLLRTFRSRGDDDVAGAAAPAQQLFSLLFYQDYLVASVGPPETYAVLASEADRTAPLALGPADACCGGLHMDDALLLYRYARSLVRRQVGEAWAPVCLPRFNSTGYLWCYAVNFSRYIRELRGERGLSVWPDLWAARGEQDLLLIHISASQDDFTPLSRCTRRFAQLLYAPAVGDNFYYRLEEELCYRTPAPLTELLGSLQTSRGTSNVSPLPPLSSSALPSRNAGGVPLWYGLLLQGGDPAFLTSDEVAETHTTTEAATAAAAAAMHSLHFTTADIRLLFESQPSPLLNLTTVDDVKTFYESVIRYQAQLRAIPASSASPSMLLVRHSRVVTFALVQPTVSTLTTLAQCYFSTKAPFDAPGNVDEEKDITFLLAGGASEATSSTLGNPTQQQHHESRRGVSFSAWVEAVRALGVVELTVALAASTPDALVWYWVARVLFMAVQRRARYVVRQLIGKQ